MAIPHLKRVLYITGAVGVVAFALLPYLNKPRVLAVEEVPIAYWAWRTNAPDPVDVEKAFSVTNAKTLFIRAGQLDRKGSEFRRIRPLEGRLPRYLELHLVYNATPDVLRDLDSIDMPQMARTIADTYKADLARSRNESAQVFGIQLDLDFPNRLLPKYAALLQELRGALPPDTKLSITGLPAWMASDDLTAVLGFVDFWIPQCYGGKIPTHISQRIPISSPSEVANAIILARSLGKPFYAGLSAYSYAILYDANGKLLEIRGNIDPSEVERHNELQQVDGRAFSSSPREMRYEYRAKSDVVLNGLVVRAGQSVVFDVPSAESLRATARAVRENAGDGLLGICIFRIPTATDRAVLSVSEIAAALTEPAADVVR